jgi:hypothetical protein
MEVKVRKFQGHHSADKNVPHLLKDIFQKEYRQKKGQANIEWCGVLQIIEGRRQCFGAPNVKLPCV